MDEFKPFCKFEDNGDNTMTMTFRPKEGAEMCAVVNLSFDEVLAGLNGVVDFSSEEAHDLMGKITIIPNNVDAL